MLLSGEHGHGMVIDEASTLDPLIQPTSPMSLLVDWNGKGLTTTIVYSINESHFEFIRMLSKMVSTGHSCNMGKYCYMKDM